MSGARDSEASLRTTRISFDWSLSVAIFAFLTFLVWGIFALDRGMFQDETYILSLVNSWGHGVLRFFLPISTPTRIFAGAPFALALFAPSPVAALQIFYGITWFAGGVFAALVLAQIFPRRRWLAFTGGCLTICATSDYLANSLVALHYDISALFYFVMLACLLAWLRSGKRRWLALSVAALAVSLGNTDVAFAPILLTPGLLWLVEGSFNRRVRIAAIVMACVFTPYAFVFLKALLNPSTYTGEVIRLARLGQGTHRVAAAYLHNFIPWTWGRARLNWFPPLPPVVPGWIRFAGPVAGSLAFLTGSAWIRHAEPRRADAGTESRERDFALLFAFLAMALACNSQQGILVYSQFFYRTQILSRYWSSLALALAADMLIRLHVPFRWAGALLPLAFVGLGVDGGLDRQDYYLAYWRRHRVELNSIVEAAPRLAPSASLVLLIPEPPPYFVATQADYLAQSWASLLYDDASMWTRTLLIGPNGDQHCSAEADQIVCRDSSSKVLATATLSSAVILSYDETRNHYFLAEQIPPQIETDSRVRSSSYRPRRLILAARPTSMARRIFGRTQ